MKIGFTGTREGMTFLQKMLLGILIDGIYQHEAVDLREFHHGSCMGADAEAHYIVIWRGPDLIVHPPEDERYMEFCEDAKEYRDPLPYLERNRNIVDETNFLIAAPLTNGEVQRSGTWSTIRYARKKGKPVLILPRG